MDELLAIISALWPVLVGLVGLVVVLAQMHARLQVAEEKIKTLFELRNKD